MTVTQYTAYKELSSHRNVYTVLRAAYGVREICILFKYALHINHMALNALVFIVPTQCYVLVI